MFKLISTYKENTYEYEQLRIAAEMLTAKSEHGYRYYVADTYFDYGQDWMWTTILRVDDSALIQTSQALTPEQQEKIIFSRDLQATTDEIVSAENWEMPKKTEKKDYSNKDGKPCNEDCIWYYKGVCCALKKITAPGKKCCGGTKEIM